MKFSYIFRITTIVYFFILCFSGLSQSLSDFTPVNIQKAYQNDTRTKDGIPGSKYWQNKADYSIQVTFDPETRNLKGSESITYYNNSPDTLTQLLFMLYPDLYKQGNPRDFIVERADEHPGVSLFDFSLNNTIFDVSRFGSDMIYHDTYAWLPLKSPILPGSTTEIEMSWEYRLNERSHMRTGQVDHSSFFIAYWFPRIGVYDDINGWNPYPYTGVGEFYNDFGDFDVQISVPADFVVWATGELQNPHELLNEDVLQRYNEARQTDDIISIIGPADLEKGGITLGASKNTWKYKATNVMDFAFAFSDHYLWDASSPAIGRNNEKVFLSTAYPQASPDFPEVIHIAKKSMTYMVGELPGLPFPYPALTVFNGLDEMEYPMMVNDHSFHNLTTTFQLTAHEICHSYFPFMMGCNEKKYAWMDEGLTSFFEYNIIHDLVDTNMISLYFLDDYLEIAGTGNDIPLITPSDLIRSPEYYAISYPKAAAMYSELLHETGRNTFKEVLKAFASRWEGKHPTGHDLINTFLDVGGSDLQYLFKAWLFEFGYVDLGISSVTKKNGHTVITIECNGNYPAGCDLIITYIDNSTNMVNIKPSVWFDGNRKHEIRINHRKEILSLKIKKDIPVDINSTNDTYK